MISSVASRAEQYRLQSLTGSSLKYIYLGDVSGNPANKFRPLLGHINKQLIPVRYRVSCQCIEVGDRQTKLTLM